MRIISGKIADSEGSITVVALLILVVLTIIGVGATTTAEIELQIAGNQRFNLIAFENADSGVYVTPKLISACIEYNDDQSFTDVTYLGSPGTFYREIMGFDPHDSDSDVRFVVTGSNVDVDVNRLGVQYITGGSIEFGSGSEGVGVGSPGGIAIFYDIDSFGEGPGSSQANVAGIYRKLVGVPGGL
jgi:Tfp pilus assembly protein PilX